MKLAFLGLGVMGFPMAGHLAQAGHTVCVYNRSADKARRWLADYPGTAAATPAAAVAEAEICFLCVGADPDVREVLTGPQGVLTAMPAGGLVVDHTTASAQLAREMHAHCRDRQLGFIDAPVSGGQAGAENGALTIMMGGDEADFERLMPVLEAYARCSRRIGGSGAGQLAKMVNQICIAGVVQGLAEAMTFSQQAGLDTAAVIEVIRQGAAQSWQMENRSATMLAGEYEHGFAVDWMRKDLAMVLEEARAHGLELPVTSLVDGFYGEVQAMGGNRWDTSSLLVRMQARASQGTATSQDRAGAGESPDDGSALA